MIRRGLSYRFVFFSSATFPGDTLHCSKRLVLFWEEGPSGGLFDKYLDPAPSEIYNSTTPPYAPGDPVEAGIFNASNQAEYIALVRNQGLEVDDDIEPAPDNVPLVDTPDSDTLFEGKTWGWYGIDRRAVVA